jgi:urease accessory protein
MKSAGKSETLTISRSEGEKSRLRRRTDKGKDVGIVLMPGTQLNHGDVLVSDPERFVIVQQEPEPVMTIKISDTCPKSKLVSTAASLGHTIGNMHRPISMRDKEKSIAFPLQSCSEFQLFERSFATFSDYVDMRLECLVFLPDKTVPKHER